MAGGRHAGPPGQGGRVRLPPHVARLVLLVSAVVGVDTIFYAALAPLLPYYQHSAGLTEAGAGVLVAAYAAGTLVGALPSGALVARVGARPGLLVGLALMSVSSAVFGFASSIAWLLIAARFVQGIGGAASWAAGLAWLAAAAPAERRGELLGTAFGAAVAGALLGPVVGAVADQIGTAWTFCAAAVLGAALAAWSLLVGSSEQEPQRLREALPALRARGVRLGLLLIVVSGVAYGVVEVLAPLQLDAAGATALFISATFLLAAVLATVASPLVGRLSDVRGAAWPTRLSLAGIIGLSVLAAFVTPLWSLAVIFVLGLPFFDALMVPTMAAVSDGAQAAGLHQGLAFALVNFAWAGGMTVAAAGSGAMAEAAGDWVPYLFLVAVCLSSWVAAGRLSAGREPPR